MSLDLSILSIKTSFTTSTTATCIYISIFPLFTPHLSITPTKTKRFYLIFFFIQISQEPGTTSGKCSFSILGFGNPKKNPKNPKNIKNINTSTPESFCPKRKFAALSGNAKMVENGGKSNY